MLREERELKYSTIANYVRWLCPPNSQDPRKPLCSAVAPPSQINGIFNVTNYCFAALEPAADALRLEPSSLEQLLNMRAQSEKLAKEDRLFQRKDPNWVDWPTVQAGRIKCLQEWRASAGKPFAQRQKLLRELLIMLFHSVQPPDRGAPRHTLSLSCPGAPLIRLWCGGRAQSALFDGCGTARASSRTAMGTISTSPRCGSKTQSSSAQSRVLPRRRTSPHRRSLPLTRLLARAAGRRSRRSRRSLCRTSPSTSACSTSTRSPARPRTSLDRSRTPRGR